MKYNKGLFWLGFWIFMSVIVNSLGRWSVYQPRPGVECAAFHIDHQSDVDCYEVK